MIDIYNAIQFHLAERMDVDIDVLNGAKTLTEIGVDSLLMVELAFELEQKFGVRIDDSLPMEKMTLREIADYITSLCREESLENMDAN
jgi:acyl carrier protein